MRKSGIHRYRCYFGSLDEEKDLVRYREMTFTCQWMTLDRFKEYRDEIIEDERAYLDLTFPPDQNIELWLGENFVLPPSLLRYPSTSDRTHRSRGLDVLNYLAIRCPLKLDPYTDGDERCCHFFSQAIAAKDYRTVFSLVYGNLIAVQWIPELAATLARMETNHIRSMYMFLSFMVSYFSEKLQRMTEAGGNGSRLPFLHWLQEQIEDSCSGKEDIDIGYWLSQMAHTEREVDGWNFCHEWFDDDDEEGGPWSEYSHFVRQDFVWGRTGNMSIDYGIVHAQDSEHSSNDET